MTEVLHMPTGRVVKTTQPTEAKNPFQSLIDQEKVLVAFSYRPVSVPIVCNAPEPDAIINTANEYQVNATYKPRPKPKQSASSVTVKLHQTQKKKPIMNQASPQKPLAASKPTDANKPQQKPSKPLQKPEKAPVKKVETPEQVKVKDPAIEEEKIKKLRELVKNNIRKHKDLELKLEADAQQALEKKRLEKVEEIKEKAREALLASKFKSFQPKGNLGVDEKVVRGRPDKEREKAIKERELSEKAKEQYRKKVKEEGRARIGLEILDMYPEMFANRGSSREKEVDKKIIREKNPQLQNYIREKKLREKEEKLMNEMIENEKIQKKVQVLKELELLAKPKGKANIGKRQGIMKMIRQKADGIRKRRQSESRETVNASHGEELDGKYEFIVDHDKFDISGMNKSDFKIDRQRDDENNRKTAKKTAKDQGRKGLNLKMDSEPSVSYGNESGNYEDEEFESEISSNNPRVTEKAAKDHISSHSRTNEQDSDLPEKLGRESTPTSEEFNESKVRRTNPHFERGFSQESEEFSHAGEESYQEGEESYQEGEGSYQAGEESYEQGEESYQEEEYSHSRYEDEQTSSDDLTPAAPQSNPTLPPSTNAGYPGNSLISPGFQKYSVHPKALSNPRNQAPIPISDPTPVTLAPQPQSKESIRTKLADLEARVNRPLNPPAEIEKIEIQDDFELKLYKIPGVLAMDDHYALQKIHSQVEIYRAASKIQAIVRGYLTRKNLIRLQFNIPSNKQINKDIHGILLKYYPEAYVPDFFGSSAIPESISMLKSEPQMREMGVNTKPVQKTPPFEHPLMREKDEYNLIQILVSENLMIEPEELLNAESYPTEEAYTEEFDSISEEIQSSGRLGTDSIKESIAISKQFEKSSKTNMYSIPESIDDRVSRNLEKSLKSKHDSIQESLDDYSKKSYRPKHLSGSIQESIEEYSEYHDSAQKSKKMSSGKYDEISEEIEGFKKTSSVRFIDENIEVRPSARRPEESEGYEDDFESLSSDRLKYQLGSNFAKEVTSGRTNVGSAKILEERLVSGLDALDRARAREYEVEALIYQKKLSLEQEAIRMQAMVQRKQEMFLQEVREEKEENLNRFQEFMKEMMRQQQECFMSMASMIASSLNGRAGDAEIRRPEFVVPKLELDKPVPVKIDVKPQTRTNVPQKVVAAKMISNRAGSESSISEEIEQQSGSSSRKSAFNSSKEPKSRLGDSSSSRRLAKEVSFKSSNDSIPEDIYESQFESYISSKKSPPFKKPAPSESEEIYESQFDSYVSSKKSPAIKKPVPSESEEIYESQFDSYVSSKKSQAVKPQPSESEEIYESQFDSYTSSKPPQAPISKKSSSEEIYESQFDSYTESSKILSYKGKDLRKDPESEKSISEDIYESQFESYNESNKRFPLVKVTEKFDESINSPKESEEKFVDSSQSLQIPGKKKEPDMLIVEDGEESSRKSIPKLPIPVKVIDPESRFSQMRSSEESPQEEIAESIYSDDFESERTDKKSISHRSKSSNNHKTLANFNTKFPTESQSSSLSSPHKISNRSNRRSPDLRSSTSSISEDLDVYDSFSRQSANLENSLRRSASLVESIKQSKTIESVADSVYSEDFESESRSFKPSYSSDFESISQSDTKNLKGLHASIKEVSPEDSESHEISESLHETENEYSADFDSESKKQRTARSDSRDIESSGKKRKLEEISEEEAKEEEIDVDKVDEITEALYEMIKEDALLLLYDREVNEIVDLLYKRIIEDSLRLVPNKKVYVNDPDYLARTVEKYVESCPEAINPPAPVSILDNFLRDSSVKFEAFEAFPDFTPATSSDLKKSFKSMHKAIADCASSMLTKFNLSISEPVKPQNDRDAIQKTIKKCLNTKIGLIKSCITHDERKAMDIQREASMKEAVHQEIEDENPSWLNFEKFEVRALCEVEKSLFSSLLQELVIFL